MAKRKREKSECGAAASAEISVYISPVMLCMAVFFVAFGMVYEFACSLAAVLLHELAHARVAKKLGYSLTEIKIMPYGAALCGKADMRAAHEIAIAIAGPLFNLVVGTAFAALWWLVPTSYAFTETFCKCNIYIGIFNLLPVHPLDGGRIALALLSIKLRRKKAYAIMRAVSATVGLASLALFVVSAIYALNICFLSVGVFMLASAFIPDARAEYYALFGMAGRAARLEKPLKVQRYAVSARATLSELVKMLDPDRMGEFEVLDDALERCGFIDEKLLLEGVKRLGYEASVGALAAMSKNAVNDRVKT
ncbi:MAG: M50 family metallopeptidase [Roseburia sp.]|nr:M50 family metallopeptidase [Roseburia sp.]